MQKEKTVVKNMLIGDILRGKHSTGMVVVNEKMVSKEKETSVIKRAMNAVDFLDLGTVNTALNALNCKLILGHNRYATKGSINNINAHPFEFNRVVGVHNGTLTTQVGLKDHHQFDVDSENLYWDLEHTTIDELYPRLHGALALVWWDKVANTLNFVRNEERPLFFAYSKDNTVLYWASEIWMLLGMADRNGVGAGGCGGVRSPHPLRG